MKSKIIFSCLILLALLTAGCGDDGVAELEGTLLLDGQPAPEGIGLAFDSLEPGVRGAAGVTGPGGKFKAIYSISRDGCPTGECRARLAIGNEMSPPEQGQALNKKYPDEYYTEISTFEVKSGSNTIELEITSKE